MDPLCSSAASDPQISANDGPKLTPAAAIARPFNPRIRHKLDQPSFQYLGADSPRSSNPHRTCERRQRLFLNAVSSLGGFPTPASSCLAPPRARGRRPKPFTIADAQPNCCRRIHLQFGNKNLSVDDDAIHPSCRPGLMLVSSPHHPGGDWRALRSCVDVSRPSGNQNRRVSSIEPKRQGSGPSRQRILSSRKRLQY